MARFFDHYLLGVLGCFFLLVAGHAVVLRQRRVAAPRALRVKSPRGRIEDFLGGTIHVIRIYETIAYAWPLSVRPGEPLLGIILVEALPFKVLGAVLCTVALALNVLAHLAFGSAWRMPVATTMPARLVVRGPFACSRNPIYLSFVLLALGTFLILGQLIFLLIAVVSIPLLHRRILREEQFLIDAYGEAYGEYCAKVPRYWKWNCTN